MNLDSYASEEPVPDIYGYCDSCGAGMTRAETNKCKGGCEGEVCDDCLAHCEKCEIMGCKRCIKEIVIGEDEVMIYYMWLCGGCRNE